MEAVNGSANVKGLRHFNLNLGSGQFEKCQLLCDRRELSIAAFIRNGIRAVDPVLDSVLSGADVLHLLAVTTSGNIQMTRWF